MNEFLAWYSYENMGVAISGIMFLASICIIVFRFVLAFRNYIYTGAFGKYNRSLTGWAIEHDEKGTHIKYAFTGYHPLTTAFDALVFGLIAGMAQGLWGVYLVGGLVLLLARTMRQRIARKQEFIAKLEGNHNE